MNEQFNESRFNRSSREYDPDIAWRQQESDTLDAEWERARMERHPFQMFADCPTCGRRLVRWIQRPFSCPDCGWVGE